MTLLAGEVLSPGEELLGLVPEDVPVGLETKVLTWRGAGVSLTDLSRGAELETADTGLGEGGVLGAGREEDQFLATEKSSSGVHQRAVRLTGPLN